MRCCLKYIGKTRNVQCFTSCVNYLSFPLGIFVGLDFTIKASGRASRFRKEVKATLLIVGSLIVHRMAVAVIVKINVATECLGDLL